MKYRYVRSIEMVVGVVVILCVGWALSDSTTTEPPDTDMDPISVRAAFDDNYENWKAHCQEVAASSEVHTRLDSPHYRAIVEQGPAVLPYIVEKRKEDPDFHWIAWAWMEITRIVPDPSVYPWAEESIVSWWEAGPSRFEERFLDLTRQWKELCASGEVLLWVNSDGTRVEFDPQRQGTKMKKSDGQRHASAFRNKETELGRTYRSIMALGIAALPCAMEVVEQGDYDSLWIVNAVTHGEVEVTGNTREAADECLNWWDNNKEDWVIPWPESPSDR